MATTEQHPLRGRPTRAESDAIDRRLRDAAIAAFVANGFEGTTMESVAASAGVTKRTLYAKYPDKHALFAGVIPQALADMPFQGVALEPPDGDLRTALRWLGGHIVARLVAPQSVDLRRLALLEASRLAELDQVVGADLWSTSLRSVVDLLAAHVAAGDIVVDDLEAAADLFVTMVAGGPTIWADFGLFRSPEDEAHRIDQAVELFLFGTLPRR